MSALAQAAPRPGVRVPLRALQNGVLRLLVFSGGFAIVEPSPYEVAFMLAALVFAVTGLKFDRLLAPLIVGLALFNVGGLTALIPWTDNRDSVIFVVITLYVSLTAIFFACVMQERPLERLAAMRGAFVLSAACASMAGILGYFDVAGLAEPFTKFGRATGTFKDPNVFGPFLVLPLVWLVQSMLLREARGFLRTYLPLLVILAALFLSFSRGAWGVAIGSVGLMVLLTFVTTQSRRLQLRIVGIGLAGLVGLGIMLAIALSIPSIREIFEVRFSLQQDYDLGEFGRFGAQLRALPMLLERPLGFGPLQFRYVFFGEDPHNVYVNSFASYGWLGGLSYCGTIAATLYVGWRLVFLRTPVQAQAIALWSCLFIQILQGFQIDTDHWRHLWLYMGCVWGLAAWVRREAYLRATAKA